MDNLGTVIRNYRQQTGMTQAALAELAGTSPAYLSQIESGKVALPSPDLRRRLAQAMRVRHIDLLVAAGELTPEEIPGPTQPARNLNDPVERLCDLLHQIDLGVDRRAEGLERTLTMFRDQDRADGLITEMVGNESREAG